MGLAGLLGPVQTGAGADYCGKVLLCHASAGLHHMGFTKLRQDSP